MLATFEAVPCLPASCSHTADGSRRSPGPLVAPKRFSALHHHGVSRSTARRFWILHSIDSVKQSISRDTKDVPFLVDHHFHGNRSSFDELLFPHEVARSMMSRSFHVKSLVLGSIVLALLALGCTFPAVIVSRSFLTTTTGCSFLTGSRLPQRPGSGSCLPAYHVRLCLLRLSRACFATHDGSCPPCCSLRSHLP